MKILSKKTNIKDAFQNGHQSFYRGVSDAPPKALNIYAQKEWLRGWNSAYFQQREKAIKGVFV